MNLPETLILPQRTVAGHGSVLALGAQCAAFGQRGLLVHGASLEANGMLSRITASAPGDPEIMPWLHPGGEPTLEQLDKLLRFARGFAPDWIAAVGGGSVIDVAKACAGLLTAPLPPADYQAGAKLPPGRTPFIAAPTTAGTGSEATFVSVLTNEAQGLKKSIRHPSHMARLVILDPDLLLSCPPGVVAASGMDAFTQAVESFVSSKATWFSEALALKAAVLTASSVEAAFRGEGGECTRDLLEGSYLAGLALSHSRLGVVHGLAHPLGCHYHIPHGLVCAACLPAAIAFNRDAMGEKYTRLSNALGQDLLTRTWQLMEALQIESPFKGGKIRDEAGIIAEALASGSTAANPRPVTAEAVAALLRAISA